MNLTQALCPSCGTLYGSLVMDRHLEKDHGADVSTTNRAYKIPLSTGHARNEFTNGVKTRVK